MGWGVVRVETKLSRLPPAPMVRNSNISSLSNASTLVPAAAGSSRRVSASPIRSQRTYEATTPMRRVATNVSAGLLQTAPAGSRNNNSRAHHGYDFEAPARSDTPITVIHAPLEPSSAPSAMRPVAPQTVNPNNLTVPGTASAQVAAPGASTTAAGDSTTAAGASTTDVSASTASTPGAASMPAPAGQMVPSPAGPAFPTPGYYPGTHPYQSAAMNPYFAAQVGGWTPFPALNHPLLNLNNQPTQMVPNMNQHPLMSAQIGQMNNQTPQMNNQAGQMQQALMNAQVGGQVNQQPGQFQMNPYAPLYYPGAYHYVQDPTNQWVWPVLVTQPSAETTMAQQQQPLVVDGSSPSRTGTTTPAPRASPRVEMGETQAANSRGGLTSSGRRVTFRSPPVDSERSDSGDE